MALTAAAGLPQLVTRGSNADEGMRKLWAMYCAQARLFLKSRGKQLVHRLRIKDGDDDGCVSVGYDVNVIEDLRKRILITAKTAAADASSAGPSTSPGAGGTAASPLGGLSADLTVRGHVVGVAQRLRRRRPPSAGSRQWSRGDSTH